MLQLEFCLLKFFVFFDGENKEIGEMVNEYNLPTEFYGVLVGEIWHLLFSLFLLCLFTSLNNLCASWINKELQ